MWWICNAGFMNIITAEEAGARHFGALRELYLDTQVVITNLLLQHKSVNSVHR